MSKQYLTTHTADNAHLADIFSIAATPTCLFSASGSSKLMVHSTQSSDYPLLQTIEGAHKLGCHHIASSQDGSKIVSVGFGGEVKIWSTGQDGMWAEVTKLVDGIKAGEIWAVSLSHDGHYLASTTYDGRINMWDVDADLKKVQEFETKGSFGMCIDMTQNGSLIASGHASGSVYVFNIESRRLLHAPPGLLKPVRSIKFSPHSALFAAAGDSRIVALYDTNSGEQIANLMGHHGWIFSLDWSSTGEYLASGGWEGKVRVWSIERRECVSVVGSGGGAIWSVCWLKGAHSSSALKRSDGFATAGAQKSINFYREAAGS